MYTPEIEDKNEARKKEKFMILKKHSKDITVPKFWIYEGGLLAIFAS